LSLGRSGSPARAIEVIEKLNKEANTALGDPTIETRLAELGYTPTPMSIADFRRCDMPFAFASRETVVRSKA